MNRYVKILLEDKRVEPIFMTMEKWNALVEDPSILVRYVPEGSPSWDVKTLNKTKVVYAEFDEKYSRSKNESKWEFYKHIPTNTVRKFPPGTLPKPGTENEYKKL